MPNEVEVTKKNKTALIIEVFIVFITIIGVAVAAYTWSFTSKRNSITTGSISMSMLESTDAITIDNAFPISDAEGKNLSHSDGNSGVFDFSISTYASGAPGNIVYTISVTKASVDNSYTPLADNQVKIYLAALDGENEVQVMAPKLVSQVITSGSSGTLPFDNDKTQYLTHVHTQTDTTKIQRYRLKMWIDSNVNASNWSENTKLQYKLKVSTNGQLSS